MNDEDKPTTNKGIITIVVLTLAINGTFCVATFCYSLIFDKKPEPVVFTAFVGITNFILGAIGGMLVKTSPTESTQQVSLSNGPTIEPSQTDQPTQQPTNP